MAGAAVKPAPFAYAAPRTLDEALGLLDGRDDAVALAGGQSLVPMLNFRLARPAIVVDLNRIDGLDALHVGDDGALRIGALARQAALEHAPSVGRGWPLLHQAVRLVAHPAIRSRGTVGGSVVHADPRAELPAALLALDARLRLVSRAGERVVALADFVRGPMWTALAPGELLREIEVPPLPPDARTAFVEHTRTHGDYALAAVAVALAPGARAAVAVIGAGPVPARSSDAEAALVGGAPAAEVGAAAATGVGDAYRAALIAELTTRAVVQVRA
ncbi:MAG TPA: FAD binding domain-containing protein [Solirubrobacteraceae bacterium]